ncbi:hypothetical protein M3J09_002827 [Ascochyta lentis]
MPTETFCCVESAHCYYVCCLIFPRAVRLAYCCLATPELSELTAGFSPGLATLLAVSAAVVVVVIGTAAALALCLAPAPALALTALHAFRR